MGLASKGSLKELHTHYSKTLRETIPDSLLWKITHDVSAGLQHMHRKGYLHMDIKPANLLINENNNILIGDFGMVVRIGERSEDREGDNR